MNTDKYLHYLDSLSEYRRVHSLNVSAEAVRYAEKYGGDVEKARLAGLLHDCAKGMSNKERLSYCDKYNLAWYASATTVSFCLHDDKQRDRRHSRRINRGLMAYFFRMVAYTSSLICTGYFWRNS